MTTQSQFDFTTAGLFGVPEKAEKPTKAAIPESIVNEFCAECLGTARQNAERISAKFVVEILRARLKVEINNSDVSTMARIAVERHPQLKPLIEFRERKK